MDERTYGRTNERTDGRMNVWTDERTYGRTNVRTDKRTDGQTNVPDNYNDQDTVPRRRSGSITLFIYKNMSTQFPQKHKKFFEAENRSFLGSLETEG